MSGSMEPPSAQGSDASMTAPDENVFGAFGAVLGYIGAEAATTVAFERLLWPQRYYSNFQLSSVPSVAGLTAMGGPVHKAALATLDTFFFHGLFKGAYQGHMLGTAFFQERGWTYTMFDGKEVELTESARNCFWARALSLVPIPIVVREIHKRPNSPSRVEKATPKEQAVLRARVSVNHLTLSAATPADRKSGIPFVSEDTKTPSLRVFLGICTSELSGIIVAIVIAAMYRSLWAMLWLLPLFVRLIAAISALHRDRLISTGSNSSTTDPAQHFEIHYPQSEGNFMILTGPPNLVRQFFCHYGHPKRDRFREIIQLTVVVLLGLSFPVGLLCSVLWMPVSLQYGWMSYQLYLVLTMHIARYWGVENITTTEAKIADALISQTEQNDVNGKQAAILFGHSIDGPETIKVGVSITYHGRYKEGRQQTMSLLERPAV